MSRLASPAAAISSARLATACPLTSRRSGSAAAATRRSGTASRSAAGVGGLAGQEGAHDVEQMAGAADRQAADRRRLVGAGERQHQRARAFARRSRRAASPAPIASAPGTGRSSPPSDSSPANSKPASRGGIDLPGRGQDAERDRQVEAARFLRQVGRRQADRDPLVVRELEAAGLQRRAHPLARLLDFGVGQTHQREARQAVGEMHLDRDRGRFEAAQGTTVDDGKGHGSKAAERRPRGQGGCGTAPVAVRRGDSVVPSPGAVGSASGESSRLRMGHPGGRPIGTHRAERVRISTRPLREPR